MSFCSNCGSSLTDSDNFCGNCGKKIAPRKPKETSKPLMAHLKKLSEEATSISSSLSSSIKEIAQQIDESHSSEKTFSEEKDQAQESRLASSKLEEYKRVLAWIVDTNTQALLDLANNIMPHMHSYVVTERDRVTITDTGGPATIDSLLFNLNYIDIMGRNTFTDFGVVPDSITIPSNKVARIRESFDAFVSAYLSTKETAKAISDVSNPLSSYATELGSLCKKEKITDIKKLRKYEETIKKFLRNLEKTDLGQYNQIDYEKYLDSSTGKHVVSSLSVDASYGKYIYHYSFYIHERLKTDPERYITPLFQVFDKLDQQYSEAQSLFEECEKQSGVLKGPPKPLKDKTMSSLTDFSTSFLAAASSYYVSSNSFHDSNRIDNRKNDIRKQLQRNRNQKKMIKDIYNLIYSTNLVKPILELISPY
jgi:hypothetical protein